jgi:hypothetical protein
MPDIVEGVGQRLGDRVFAGTERQAGNFLGTFDDSDDESSEETAQVIDLDGGPCRDRTYDQRIKSPVLYQLS